MYFLRLFGYGDYKTILFKIMSRVSAHVSQNRDVYLSAHGCLPGTLWYIHVPYNRKLLKEKTFANFTDFQPSAKFSPRNLGCGIPKELGVAYITCHIEVAT